MTRSKRTMLVADGDESSIERISDLVRPIGLTVAVARTGAEALELARQELPAVAAIDVELADPSGYEVCRELRERFGEELPIVFLSATRTEPHDEIAGLLLGADHYFAKPLHDLVFVARIRRLCARSLAPARQPGLTARENDVLSLLASGQRLVDIADELCISRKTASTHVEHILRKLGAHTQAQAVAFALRDGVVALPA